MLLLATRQPPGLCLWTSGKIPEVNYVLVAAEISEGILAAITERSNARIYGGIPSGISGGITEKSQFL